MIAGLSSNAAEVPRTLPGSMEISSIGGQFGYLMDKLTSAIGGLFRSSHRPWPWRCRVVLFLSHGGRDRRA